MLDKLKGFAKENGPKVGRFVMDVARVATVYAVAATTVILIDTGVTALAAKIGKNNQEVINAEVIPTEETVI